MFSRKNIRQVAPFSVTYQLSMNTKDDVGFLYHDLRKQQILLNLFNHDL